MNPGRPEALVATFERDPESVYDTWFVDNETHLEAFGAIRIGGDPSILRKIERCPC